MDTNYANILNVLNKLNEEYFAKLDPNSAPNCIEISIANDFFKHIVNAQTFQAFTNSLN
jgi:hypothetical protein